MRVEVEQEDNGRWIAEVPEVPGAIVYGNTRKAAIRQVQALVLRTLADKIAHGERALGLSHVFKVANEPLPRGAGAVRCNADQEKLRRRFRALAGSCPDLSDVPVHPTKDLRRDEGWPRVPEIPPAMFTLFVLMQLLAVVIGVAVGAILGAKQFGVAGAIVGAVIGFLVLRLVGGFPWRLTMRSMDRNLAKRETADLVADLRERRTLTPNFVLRELQRRG